MYIGVNLYGLSIADYQTVKHYLSGQVRSGANVKHSDVMRFALDFTATSILTEHARGKTERPASAASAAATEQQPAGDNPPVQPDPGPRHPAEWLPDEPRPDVTVG